MTKLCPSAQPGMDQYKVLGVVQRDGPRRMLEYLRAGLTNDKCARRSDIHDVTVAQSPCEDAWAKRPVPANVDVANETTRAIINEENLNSAPGSGSNQVA